LSVRDVLVEVGLAPERGAELHSRCLGAIRVMNVGCQIRNIPGAIQRQRQDTIVVSQDEVVSGDDVLAAGGGQESKRVLRFKPLWTGRQCAQAEYRQPDDLKFGRVAVQAPDHDARQAGATCLQSDQVSDASFVRAAAVVDYQDVARIRSFDGFEEYVDAAVVPRRANAADQVRATPQRSRTDWGAPNRNTESQAGVSDMGRCEVDVGALKLYGMHSSLLL